MKDGFYDGSNKNVDKEDGGGGGGGAMEFLTMIYLYFGKFL